VQRNISQVIVGKGWIIEKLVLSVLARGHVLIEDVPGVGKTSLVRAVADCLGLTFRRLQFTPDLMPADVTGISIYEPARSSLRSCWRTRSTAPRRRLSRRCWRRCRSAR
jgi:MoxR-like ATPase